MITIPASRVSIKAKCHCLGTSNGFKRLPMFLGRRQTNNTLIIQVKGKVKLSRNKFEMKQLEKHLCY
jgi:hypothetical protein